MSVKLQSKVSIAPRIEEAPPETQMFTAANPSYSGENTEARQLRSGSYHYWEEDKATNIPVTSPNPTHPHLLKLIPEEEPGTPHLHLAAGAAHGLQELETLSPATFSHKGADLRLRRLGDRGGTHLARKKNDIFHPAEIQEAWAV